MRWLLDFLFCLYGSLLYVIRWGPAGTKLLNMIYTLIYRTDEFLWARFHISPFDAVGHTDRNLYISQWWVLAMITFVCIRLLGQIRIVERIIPYLGLCLTAGGVLYLNFIASAEWYMSPRVWFMRFEVAALIAILLRYAHRTSIGSTSMCLGVLLAHFWFWGWMIKAPDVGYNWFAFAGFVVLPLGTILLWGVYSRVTARSFAADRPQPA